MPDTAERIEQRKETPTGSVFASWDYDKAQEAVEKETRRLISAEAFKKNKAYIEEEDHWQDGDEWVGPKGDTAVWAQRKDAVHRQFVAVDVVGEVVERVANALLKREPDVSFTPLDPIDEGDDGYEAQQEEIQMLRDLVSAWWDAVKLWTKARRAVKRSRWAGRGILRLWVPPGKLQETEGEGGKKSLAPPSGLDLSEALGIIHLVDIEPDAAAIVTDERSQTQAAVFLYQIGEKKRAEIVYVDETTDETVTHVVGDEIEGYEEYSYELAGRLTIAQMEARILLTEPIRSQQRRINFFETILNRVGETAGFPERYTLNAQPHGLWLATAPTDSPPLQEQTFRGKTYYLHPSPRMMGAAMTTDLVGLPIKEQEGNKTKETFATPGVVFKEPTDPEFAIKSARHARRTLLENSSQGHLALESKGESSGHAYQQGRAGFEDDLADTKTPLEGMLRETIEGAVALAEQIADKATEGLAEGSILERYRCVVNLKVDTGPIPAEERRENANQVEKGMLSRESAMAASGVEDVAAEIERIEAQPEMQLTTTAKRAEIIGSLMGANPDLSMVKAAIAAGYDEEEAKELFEESDTAREQTRQGNRELQDALLKGKTSPAAEGDDPAADDEA